jgi:hypothetical protein
MLDLVEGAKLIYGKTCTGLNAGTAYADWINTENMHCVWALCSVEVSGGKVGTEFQGFVSQSYAGGTPVNAACQYWRSTGVTIDRMVSSTATSGLALEGAAVGGMVAIRFDPASRSASSQKYFSVRYTSGDRAMNITYVAQPRYAGLSQVLATTSST